MNEQYLQDLYGWIKGKDASYESRYTYDAFKQKMQDPDYATTMHGWIATKDPTFEQRRPLDAFIQQVKVNQISQPAQMEQPAKAVPSKKKFGLDSSSEIGSLDLQKSNVPTDADGKPLMSKKNDALLKSVAEKGKEQQMYDAKAREDSLVNANKYGQEYIQGGSKPVDKKNSKYLNDRLKTIDSKLINNNEEYVVPQMNYQFGDLGFKFEESGMTGDWMIATAPNGKQLEISLDPFMDSKAVSESAKLQQFIRDNTPDKGLYVIEKSANEENKKINNQKDVDFSIKKISDEANTLNTELKSFLAKKDKFDKMPKGSEQYNTLQQELISDRDNLIKKQDNLKTKEYSLKKSVGKYTQMKSEQGTWLGGTWNSFLEGSSSITAGTTDFLIDIGVELTPNDMMMSPSDLKKESYGIAKKLGLKPPTEKQTYAQWKASLTEDQKDYVEDEIDDIAKKSIKKDIIPAIRKGNREVYGSSTTTPEWEQLKSKDFWGGAYLGVVKSLPAVIGGAGWAGAVQRTAQMYAQVSDGIREEMDSNPEFDNVSENEKLAVVLPIGITGAVLEEVGLRNIKGSQGLINSVMMSALGKAGVRTTAKGFRELVENEVESRLAKGLLTLGAAGLAEAETGSAQQAAEYGVKDIYNAIKGKEMFNTPDTAKEWIKDVVTAGAQEAVGGFMLGVPTAVSAAYSQKGFLKMDDNTFRVFEAASKDENIQKAFITNLKTQITQGVITTAEAKEQLNNYRNSVGLFKSLPEGLNTKQKKEAMNLLKEKRDLQNQVDGKDPSLVKKQKERIAAIDVSLEGISETAANEKATAETNRREFDALPDAEKIKLKDEAGRKLLDIISDRNDEDIVLDDETLTEFAFKDFVKQKETNNRIAEIEATLSPDAETKVSDKERKKLEKELGTLKENRDAIQEQTTNEGVLRSQQPGVELQGMGEGNAQPQATSSTETITNAKPQENLTIVESEDGFKIWNDKTNLYEEGTDEQGIAPSYATREEAEARIEELKQPVQEIDLGLDIPENPLRDVETTDKSLFDMSQNEEVSADFGPQWYNITENLIDEKKFDDRLNDENYSPYTIVSEEYHKAKVDGSNPELVKAVEDLLVSSKTQPITTQTQTNEQTTEVQPQRTGDRGTTRTAISKTTPLEGSPKVQGATGPDEQLVSVAEKYAAENGIDLKRQGEYVEVDEERAKRIAEAYEEMENNPQDPKVKKAYAELIKQTKAQYQALVDAGYKFWFIDLNNPENIDYISSPYNAMRDLRQNKQMGVFPTDAGFGSDEDVDVSQNPLLEDTGIMWAVGGLDGEMKPVTANDLFRAVHDAFGHGLEGSGFRAQGEENAWQAHSRLYTGDAVGAMTSETRGQNSWVNYGPNGEQNRTASAEDTVFADQKVGLMPEWTWTEGRASDMAAEETVAENLAEENAPEVTPGVDELFQSNPKLAEVGTPKQYSTYLASIFPKSKIKDVLYRGINSAFGTTTLFKEGKNEKGEAIYFTTNKEYALRYGDKLTAAIVNIENPKTTEYDSSKLSDKDETTRMNAIDSFQENVGFQKKENNEGFDGIEGRDTNGTNDEIAVFDKSQIHLLGTDEDVQSFKDFVEANPTEAAPEEFGTQGLSEAELPGYDRMMAEAEKIVKEKRRGRKIAEMSDAVMAYVMGSKVYEDATDVQREALVRDVRKRFGLKEKTAPSVARLFGKIKDVKKITMTEKTALKKQIRDLGRGAREAVRAFRLASQQLSKEIKELKQSGKITSDQAANVIRAFSNVNVFSEKSVDRFTTYMARVFEKADYANKLNEAKKTRTDVKKLSKNKDKNANLRDLALKFGKIDPSLVEDIDAYNALATQIKNAINGSKIRGQKVNFAETVNIANAVEYTNKEMAAQEKILRDERLAELKEIYGVDGFNFTDEEINALLESDKPMKDKDKDIVMATIKKAFNIYSTIIQDSMKNGIDVFTGEDVSFTKQQKETISKFMSMDLDKISPKNALQAVDALANFIENKSTAKMAATIATYTGDTNGEIIVEKGIYAMPLKKLFSPQFGAFLAEQTTTLPMVFEKMFKGFNRGGTVMDAMGLTKLINRKAFAERQANNIVADYVKEFYNSKSRPNGQKFNTAYNNTERGMAAFMLRTVIGTEQEMEAEFNRRKGLIEQSIEALANGNKQQQKQADLYKKVYDKVVVNSKNIQDIKDKTDSKNLEAIDYWHKQWESKFDQLSDVATGIYNKTLDKDLNYSPDKYSTLKAGKPVDLLNNESAFINNTNGILYKQKTGVLMDVTHSDKLPLNDKNKPMSYVDLSFDKNNSNSMYDALVDIETAEPIRQVQAFLKSDSYNQIIPDVDNGEMLAKRIDTYVQNIRKKNPYSNDEFAKTIKKLNKLATLGVGQALGGVTQPFKQVIPVALNTLINGQGLAVGASYNADFMNWLNNAGYAISNRGVQSQADIESLNSLIEEAANSKGQKLLSIIEKGNALMLKTFLEKPDVFIARASWKTYYEKSLKKQGIDPSTIDYSDHEVNEEAANYAQRMVDRQQNISDHDLAGNLFTDKTSKAQVLAKIFMPFASFRMNQASRLATDLSVIGHWSVSTEEDKKVALLSLMSFASEMAVFKAISAGIGIAMGYAANAWMDRDETEEEEDKRIANVLKGQATGAVTDVISPLPVFDKLLQTGASAVLDGVQEGLDITEQDKLALYSSKPQDYLKNLGLYGMAADRVLEFGKLVTLATTGEYTDDFGNQRTISSEDTDALKTMIGPALLTNVGLAPSEVAGVIRNSVKVAKKKGETFEERQEKQAKIDMFQEQLDKAVTPEEIDFATEALNRVKNPKAYEVEKETIKSMKEGLLTNQETGVTYDNVSDVKKYDRPLWEKNFGPNSEWYQVTKAKRETDKFIKQKETEAEEEKYGYVKPKKRSKNSDGTYKKSSSSSRRGFGGGSNSNSSSTSERYDSRGVKITTTRSGSRRGFN